jgi:hypothetical protein
MPSPNTERGEHDRGEQKAEQDRQRQTDPEKSFREAHIAAHDSEIRVGGGGEQHYGERQFGQKAQSFAAIQKAQSFAAYVDAQQASGPRTKPTTANTIGPLIKDPSIRPATAL